MESFDVGFTENGFSFSCCLSRNNKSILNVVCLVKCKVLTDVVRYRLFDFITTLFFLFSVTINVSRIINYCQGRGDFRFMLIDCICCSKVHNADDPFSH